MHEPPNLIIRDETASDVAAVRAINQQAFDSATEADLVDLLRTTCPERLSLVAQRGTDVVGHILFTPALLKTEASQIDGMGLAPMAVLPQHQQKGVGSALVRRGLARVRAAGYPFVVVLGHPSYYPRFGFERASHHDLSCAYENVPDEAFMVRVFQPDILASATGTVHYRPEFDAAI
jgi:putative acetyltransferase